jgi:uncharacterized protein (TIGR03083 family)
MADPSAWIGAVRRSHDRFIDLVAPLDEQGVQARSYDAEWSIAQVASHLGSQAEIFTLFLTAGLSGGDAPGGEQFGPIWDRWNNLPPGQQVAGSVTANERFLSQLEELSDEQRSGFGLSMLGADQDLVGLTALRLGEHAVHTWDVAVALDPAAVVAADAVELLLDTLPATAALAGTPAASAREIVVETSAPERRWLLTTGPDVVLMPYTGIDSAVLHLPAEALLRLVYGRLDPDHTPTTITGAEHLAVLRPVFPGF